MKILIVTYSGQGHVKPSFRFAKRLLNMGVHVTYSTSLSVIRTMQNKTIHHRLTFAPFSDAHHNTTLDQFISDFATNGASAVAKIITSASQPFDHLVYTTVIPWAARVAHAHGIKSTLLWCQPATVLNVYYYYFNQFHHLISSNNNNPTFPINLPGLPPLTVADLPSFILAWSPKEHDFLVPIMKDHVDVLELSPRILVNSFDELEFDSLRAIEKVKYLPIGPLVPSKILDPKESINNSSSEEVYKEDYMQWLNTKAKSSVVYVAFGTIATFSMDQLEEIAIGLLQSLRPFLWVIGKTEKLTKIEELKKQGMIVDWCSQFEVLSHQAIGCFLTHCGWNSTVEALAAGVPMVVFTQWSDQGTNGKMVEDVWRTGIKVKVRKEDGMVEGREINRCLEIVMEDEEMKKNTEKWKNLASEALNNGTINLQAFLDDISN